MRNVFQSTLLTEASLVRDMLSRNGIAAKLVEGRSPHPQTAHSEIWVPDDEYERAAELVRGMYSESGDVAPWACRKCREPNPTTFDTCWRCGTPRPD